MTGDPKKLAALGQVAEAAWAIEQARLSQLAAQEAEIRRKLSALDQGRADRAQDVARGPDAARLAGVDPLWETWIDGRKSRLISDLARTRAQMEEARLKFGRAYGRKETVAKLLGRLEAERRRARDQL